MVTAQDSQPTAFREAEKKYQLHKEQLIRVRFASTCMQQVPPSCEQVVSLLKSQSYFNFDLSAARAGNMVENCIHDRQTLQMCSTLVPSRWSRCQEYAGCKAKSLTRLYIA